MMRCEELSERLPLLAAGAAWTTAESTHLAGCSACAAEWMVVRAGRRLGTKGPQLDATEVATRVLARLQDEASLPVSGRIRPPVVGWARRAGLGLAAAAVLALAIGFGRSQLQADRAGAAVLQTESLLTELEGLTPAELEEIVAQLELDNVGSVTDSGLADLTNEELERLLRSWEG